MGWSVYYEGKADGPITSRERKILERHVKKWNPKLHEGSEPYGWMEKEGGTVLDGFTKIHSSEDDRADYVTLIRAAQELETLLPRFQFLVHDDYIEPERTVPSEVEPE